MTLMLPSLPLTVGRFISAIVVYAADGRIWGPFAHVGKEVRENHPTFADGNASSSVARPSVVVGIGASLNHLRPRTVSRGRSMLPVMSMFKTMRFFKSLTTATGFSGDCIHRAFNAAIASNKPASLAELPDMGKSDDGQSSKTQTSDIFESRHGDLSRRWLGLGTARRFSGGPFCILPDCGLQ